MNVTSEILKYAKDLGFTHTKTNGGHYKLEGYKQILFMSSSASDHRVLKKVKNSLTKIKSGKTDSKNIAHHKIH